LPVILIQICLLCSTYISVYGEKLSNLSICILAYISILDSLKNDLPEIESLTFIDIFFFTLLISSLLPCISTEWLASFGDENDDTFLMIVENMIFVFLIALCIASFTVIAYKYSQFKDITKQEAPT